MDCLLSETQLLSSYNSEGQTPRDKARRSTSNFLINETLQSSDINSARVVGDGIKYIGSNGGTMTNGFIDGNYKDSRRNAIIKNLSKIKEGILFLTNEFDSSKNFEKFNEIANNEPQMIDEIREMIHSFQLLLDCNVTQYMMSHFTSAEYSQLIDELQQQYPLTPATPATPQLAHMQSFRFQKQNSISHSNSNSNSSSMILKNKISNKNGHIESKINDIDSQFSQYSQHITQNGRNNRKRVSISKISAHGAPTTNSSSSYGHYTGYTKKTGYTPTATHTATATHTPGLTSTNLTIDITEPKFLGISEKGFKLSPLAFASANELLHTRSVNDIFTFEDMNRRNDFQQRQRMLQKRLSEPLFCSKRDKKARIGARGSRVSCVPGGARRSSANKNSKNSRSVQTTRSSVTGLTNCNSSNVRYSGKSFKKVLSPKLTFWHIMARSPLSTPLQTPIPNFSALTPRKSIQTGAHTAATADGHGVTFTPLQTPVTCTTTNNTSDSASNNINNTNNNSNNNGRKLILPTTPEMHIVDSSVQSPAMPQLPQIPQTPERSCSLGRLDIDSPTMDETDAFYVHKRKLSKIDTISVASNPDGTSIVSSVTSNDTGHMALQVTSVRSEITDVLRTMTPLSDVLKTPTNDQTKSTNNNNNNKNASNNSNNNSGNNSGNNSNNGNNYSVRYNLNNILNNNSKTNILNKPDSTASGVSAASAFGNLSLDVAPTLHDRMSSLSINLDNANVSMMSLASARSVETFDSTQTNTLNNNNTIMNNTVSNVSTISNLTNATIDHNKKNSVRGLHNPTDSKDTNVNEDSFCYLNYNYPIESPTTVYSVRSDVQSTQSCTMDSKYTLESAAIEPLDAPVAVPQTVMHNVNQNEKYQRRYGMYCSDQDFTPVQKKSNQYNGTNMTNIANNGTNHNNINLTNNKNNNNQLQISYNNYNSLNSFDSSSNNYIANSISISDNMSDRHDNGVSLGSIQAFPSELPQITEEQSVTPMLHHHPKSRTEFLY